MVPPFPDANLSKVIPASRAVELHREDVQALLDLLSDILVRSGGTTLDANSIWNTVYDNDGSSLPVTSSGDLLETFRASRARSMRFKCITSTLRTISDSLQEASDRTEKCIASVAMHLGLARLPDELLSRILWHTASTFIDAIRLCQVCTRFRTVLISAPEIWAKFPLTTNTMAAQINLIVQRSGTIPLKALIEPILFFPLNADGVLDHLLRIRELTVSPINDPVLRPRLDGIHFPALRSLGMKWSRYIRNEHGVQSNVPETNEHVYETWTMPQLLFLEANFIPHPLRGSNITRCDLTFGEDSIHVEELLYFLASSFQLQKLKMSFAHTSAWRDNRPDPVVHLPNLRSLSIHVSGETTSSLLNRILSNVSSEGLSELSLEMRSSSRMDVTHRRAFETDRETEPPIVDSDFNGWSRAASQFLLRQKCIQALHLDVEVTQTAGESKTLPPGAVEVIRDILSSLPSSLETLILWHNVTIFWSTDERRIPCIRVVDADMYTIGLLQIVKSVLMRSDFGPDQVIIDRCSGSQEEEFRALLSGSEVS